MSEIEAKFCNTVTVTGRISVEASAILTSIRQHRIYSFYIWGHRFALTTAVILHYEPEIAILQIILNSRLISMAGLSPSACSVYFEDKVVLRNTGKKG